MSARLMSQLEMSTYASRQARLPTGRARVGMGATRR
jgi:hypothetical protein